MSTQTTRTPLAFTLRRRFFCPERVRFGLVIALLAFALGGLTAVLSLASQAFAQAPPQNTLATGTRLYVRLEKDVCTRTSHLNQPVAAQVVREVSGEPGVLIPIGAEVSGKVQKLIPSSTPTDHARMLIVFNQLAISSQSPLTLAAHVVEVENARETVLADGTVQGILTKDVPVGRVDNMLDKMGSTGSEMEKMGGGTFGKADPSIDFPAGTDLVLALDQPLAVGSPFPPAAATPISPPLTEAVQKLLVDAPLRDEGKGQKPGDPLNLVIAGTSDQVLNAFQQGGWTEASKLGRKSAVGTARAVWDAEAYENAPVSELYLYGRVEDMAFEKMLNTFLKRHHLRLWQTTLTAPDGRPLWLGAATHDTGLDVRPGVVSHAIDPDLDAERAKVGADLVAGGAVAAEQLVTRPNALSEGKTATGATWRTDGQLLVLELKSTPGR